MPRIFIIVRCAILEIIFLFLDVVAVEKGLTPLFLGKEYWRKPKVLRNADRVAVWKSKELHGRFYKALSGPDVDQIAYVSWLQFNDLFGETEGFVCAIMDEVIKTRNYRKHIMKDGTLDIFQACHRPGKSLRHIVSGCSHLANGEYLHRHNQVHQQLALRFGLIDFEMPYYRYDPASVLENSSALDLQGSNDYH
ncbi:jg9142 [Pararge aegeria aegeria]|uniref:Jg9142 protein n=1 Tax=Pararge aegeria aegeria TaxID=348720 RepID=A0A8S4SKK4_9NEOP|nr:jg9142 [Pararge aegeria aegeria]